MFSMPSTFSRHDGAPALAAISSAGLKYCPPALLTSTSRRPWRSSASSISRARVARLAHVAGDRVHLAAGADDLAAAAASTSSRRPAIVTRRAAARELQRRRLAQPRAAAGHQRRLTAQHARREDRRLLAHRARS